MSSGICFPGKSDVRFTIFREEQLETGLTEPSLKRLRATSYFPGRLQVEGMMRVRVPKFSDRAHG
jgi:hypothetical protein